MTILPNVDFTDDCSFTFWFRASMNEDEFKVVIEDVSTSTPVEINNSGWINGTAKKYFCLVTTTASPGVIADAYLLPNTDYRITLETKNSCDTDSYSYEFHTANRNCNTSGGGSSFRIASTHPNPATGSEAVTVEFVLEESKQIEAMLFKVGNGGGQQSVQIALPENGHYPIGTHQLQLLPQQLAYGFNYLIFTVDGGHYYTTIVKQ
ncbi:hypothetical protein CEQ90_01675 [Lewinellaceae bacterium SD302]|nr:hypothetical protein CEQ90_01675 [Lewinellaceae bacterium SD302]